MHQPSGKFLPAAAEMIVSPRRLSLAEAGLLVLLCLSLPEQGNKFSEAQAEILSARTR